MSFSPSYLIERTASIMAAVILLQTLFFKFSGAEESIYIFTAMGMEPWGRYATAFMELFAGMMLLSRAFSALGSVISLGIMSGAILGHLSLIGIEVVGDGGWLFTLAVAVFIANLITIFFMRKELKHQISRLISMTARGRN